MEIVELKDRKSLRLEFSINISKVGNYSLYFGENFKNPLFNFEIKPLEVNIAQLHVFTPRDTISMGQFYSYAEYLDRKIKFKKVKIIGRKIIKVNKKHAF
jgi:hypothetical protein